MNIRFNNQFNNNNNLRLKGLGFICEASFSATTKAKKIREPSVKKGKISYPLSSLEVLVGDAQEYLICQKFQRKIMLMDVEGDFLGTQMQKAHICLDSLSELSEYKDDSYQVIDLKDFLNDSYLNKKQIKYEEVLSIVGETILKASKRKTLC